MHFVTTLILLLFTSFGVALVLRKSTKGYSLRKEVRGLESSDNEKFEKLLMGDGEIRICETLTIDISSWTAITPRVKKIVGDGEKSVIEIYAAPNGSIQLFDNVENVEISNLMIKINPLPNTNIVSISTGLMNGMYSCRVNGFHVIISSVAKIQLNGAEMSIISTVIGNSVMNDVGISFNEINVEYLNNNVNQDFSLVSNEVYSDNDRIVFNGIYVKGRNIYIKTGKASISNGIMFRFLTKIDFNYVVFDIERIRFDVRCEIQYGLFAFSIPEEITINNGLIIVRKSFSYEDFDKIDTNSYFAMVANIIGKRITINHCLIDIRFGVLTLNYLESDFFGDNGNLYRFMEIAGLVHTAITDLQLDANYLSVKYYLEEDCEMKKKKCELWTGRNCKAYCEPILLSSKYYGGAIHLKNSYFNVDKSNSASIEPYLVRHLNSGLVSENSYITTNGITISDGTHGVTSGDILSVYPPMMNLGYLKYGSIIYDSNIPYYDYSANNINYEIFENLKPSYDNVCDITTTPDITNSATVEETTLPSTITTETETTTSSSTTTIPSTVTTTTIPSTVTTTTIPSTVTTTTTLMPTISSSTDSIIDERVTTIDDVEVTDEEEDKRNHSNKSKSSESASPALLISSITAGSVALLSSIAGLVYYCYKYKFCFLRRKVSPESSVEMSIDDDSNSEDSKENLIGKV